MRNTNYSYSYQQYVSLNTRVLDMHVPLHSALSKCPDMGNTNKVNIMSVVKGKNNLVPFVLIIDSR